jgi:hypothetical protein
VEKKFSVSFFWGPKSLALWWLPDPGLTRVKKKKKNKQKKKKN